MRSSLISMKNRPTNDKLIQSISDEFSRFGRKIPIISMEMYGLNREMYVKGDGDDEWCWIHVFEWPVGPKNNDECKFTCAIESRGDNIFSAIIVYSLGKYFGEKIYDDAGYLKAGGIFGISEFGERLQEKFK